MVALHRIHQPALWASHPLQLRELKALQRTSSVDYQRGFLALLSHCEELTAQHKIDLFIGGLG